MNAKVPYTIEEVVEALRRSFTDVTGHVIDTERVKLIFEKQDPDVQFQSVVSLVDAGYLDGSTVDIAVFDPIAPYTEEEVGLALQKQLKDVENEYLPLSYIIENFRVHSAEVQYGNVWTLIQKGYLEEKEDE